MFSGSSLAAWTSGGPLAGMADIFCEGEMFWLYLSSH